MMQLEPGQPCPYCQVRPDVPCRHRPADDRWQMVEAPDGGDKRRNNGGDRRSDKRSSNGLNFATRTFVDPRDGKRKRIVGS